MKRTKSAYNQAQVKKRLKDEADVLWKEAVIKKYGNLCEICGKPAAHYHHFYPKGLFSILKFEIFNGVSFCFHCHFSRHHKGDPTINEKIIQKRGQKWLKDLQKKSKERLASFQTIQYYRDNIEKLK